MMKKALIFTLAVLVVLLAGCGVMPADEKESATQSQTVSFPAGNETVSGQKPTEAAKETETPVQTEEEKSSKASGSEIEETPQPTQPPAETKPVQEETVSQSPKEPEPEPTAPPEPAKPKSIYDYEFDVEAIRQELLGIGTGMGLTIDSSLTPDTASWGNPVTASKDFQGTSLERSLKDYVRSMPGLITAYGGSPIQYFTIYAENLGGGSYRFYFLY